MGYAGGIQWPHCQFLFQFMINAFLVLFANNGLKSGGILSHKRKVVVFGNLDHKSGGFMLITRSKMTCGKSIFDEPLM